MQFPNLIPSIHSFAKSENFILFSPRDLIPHAILLYKAPPSNTVCKTFHFRNEHVLPLSDYARAACRFIYIKYTRPMSRVSLAAPKIVPFFAITRPHKGRRCITHTHTTRAALSSIYSYSI